MKNQTSDNVIFEAPDQKKFGGLQEKEEKEEKVAGGALD